MTNDTRRERLEKLEPHVHFVKKFFPTPDSDEHTLFQIKWPKNSHRSFALVKYDGEVISCKFGDSEKSYPDRADIKIIDRRITYLYDEMRRV